MRRVAVGIEECGQFRRNLIRYRPQVRRRHGDVFGKRAVAVHADADRVRAQVLLAGAAVAAHAADDVAFGADALAERVAAHAGAHVDDAADEFVTDHQPRLDHALRPLVPLINVQVGAADRGLFELDQHIVRTDLGNRYLFHPDPARGFALDQGFHHRLRHGAARCWRRTGHRPAIIQLPTPPPGAPPPPPNPPRVFLRLPAAPGGGLLRRPRGKGKKNKTPQRSRGLTRGYSRFCQAAVRFHHASV